MFKLLAMLVTFLLVAFALLGLRQHRLELTSESAGIYEKIRDRHHTLLDQRVEIARRTNAWAIDAALKERGVNTGEALRVRNTTLAKPALAVPAVEADLVAPLLDGGAGHNSAARPR